MRVMRRTVMTAGFLVLALLPVAAAVSADALPASTHVPLALVQPVTVARALPARRAQLVEAGVLIAIGGGLMGLAAVVRRSDR